MVPDVDLDAAYAASFAPEKIIFRVVAADITPDDPNRDPTKERFGVGDVAWYDIVTLDVEYEYLEGKPYHSSSNIFTKQARQRPDGVWEGPMGLKMQYIRTSFGKCGFKLSNGQAVRGLVGHAFEGNMYREYRDNRGTLVGTHFVLPTKHLGDSSYKYIGERRLITRIQAEGGQGISPEAAAPPANRDEVLEKLAEAVLGKSVGVATFTQAILAVPGARLMPDIRDAAANGKLLELLDGRVSVGEKGIIERIGVANR